MKFISWVLQPQNKYNESFISTLIDPGWMPAVTADRLNESISNVHGVDLSRDVLSQLNPERFIEDSCMNFVIHMLNIRNNKISQTYHYVNQEKPNFIPFYSHIVFFIRLISKRLLKIQL
jgi:hypothetical protein